jgi:hypothetical protein
LREPSKTVDARRQLPDPSISGPSDDASDTQDDTKIGEVEVASPDMSTDADATTVSVPIRHGDSDEQ